MDIFQLVDEQLLERYKHFIIYGPSLKGKSKLAKIISNKKDGKYIDLLLEFQNNQKLKDNIDIFSVTDLREFIENAAEVGRKLLIVDHIDFLIHTWDQSQLQELYTFIEMSEDSYCCLFIMQDYKFISKPILVNEKGNHRNINIFDISTGGIING